VRRWRGARDFAQHCAWGFSRLALPGAGQGAARPCTPCLLFFGRFASRLRGCGAPRRCPALANVAEGFLAAGAARGRAGRCTPLHPVPTLSGKSRQKARHATSGQNPKIATLCAGAADCPRCAGSGQIEVSWLARRAGRLRPFPRRATPGFCPPFANAATGCRKVAVVRGWGVAEVWRGCCLPMFRRQQTPPLPAQLYCAVRGAGGHPLLALRSLTPPPACRKVAVVLGMGCCGSVAWLRLANVPPPTNTTSPCAAVLRSPGRRGSLPTCRKVAMVRGWGVAEVWRGCGLPMFRRQPTSPLPAQLRSAVRGAGGHPLLGSGAALQKT